MTSTTINNATGYFPVNLLELKGKKWRSSSPAFAYTKEETVMILEDSTREIFGVFQEIIHFPGIQGLYGVVLRTICLFFVIIGTLLRSTEYIIVIPGQL